MKKFGLIGFPLGHSMSAKHFSAKFENEKTDARYDLYELRSISEFEALKQNPELCGLNVTIPYKEKIIPYLDELDVTAAAIGAVNVIKFIRNGDNLLLKGYNTDALGFEQSLAPQLKTYHTNALILGTGGAAKAVEYALKKHSINAVYVSRTKRDNSLTYSELTEKIISGHLLIINATPLGMFPNTGECPPLPYEFITEKHLLADAVYNPVETLFLKKGKEHGATIINGVGMWAGQAAATWEIWEE